MFWFGENDVSVMVGWPSGVPDFDRPLWLVVARYPKKRVSSNFHNGSKYQSKEDWEIHFAYKAEDLPGGKRFEARYEVSSKQPVERFSAGEQTFTAEKGRVFLVDLTAEPPRIIQVKSDLRDRVATQERGRSPPGAAKRPRGAASETR